MELAAEEDSRLNSAYEEEMPLQETFLGMVGSVANKILDEILLKLLKLKHRKYLFLLIAIVIAATLLYASAVIVYHDYKLSEHISEIPVIYHAYDHVVESEEISKIVVNWYMGDVEFIVSQEAEHIRIKEYSDKRLLQSQLLEVSISNNELIVKWKSGSLPFQLMKNTTKNLKIEIPQTMASTLGSVTCENNEGDIVINEIYVENLELSSNLGSIKNNAVEANTMSLKTKSGDILLNTSKSDILNISTGTGAIAGEGIASPVTKAMTAFGNINLSGTFSELLEIYSTKGAIQINTYHCPSTTDLQSVHGSIQLKLPQTVKDEGFELDYYRGYGTLEVSFPPMKLDEDKGSFVYGNGKYKIKLRTTDGAMAIQEATS